MTNSNLHSLDAPDDLDRQPIVARLETDRLCDHCGYNLVTQAVRRDSRTQLLLCRCPECGRLLAAGHGATAGRVWLQRLGTLLLLVWVLLVLSGAVGLGMAQGGLTYGLLDELTTFAPISPSAPASSPARPPRAPATTQVTFGSTTIIIPQAATGPGGSTRWQRTVRPAMEYDTAFKALMLGLAAGLGFTLAMWITVTMHHWPRWTYWIPVVVAPLAAGAIVWYAWDIEYPHLGDWAKPWVLWSTLAGLVGGMFGIYLGRPLARLVLTLTLPPKTRQVLAFLWLVDGKMTPRAAPAPL